MRLINLFLLLSMCTVCFGSNLNMIQLYSYKTHPVVKLFQEYLRIDTSRPGNLDLAVQFWSKQANSLPNAEFNVYRPAGMPICVIKIPGSDGTLPAIMLNSHMDVVAADAKQWKYPPFHGIMDNDGNIYGRGAQDTKDVSIHYLEALKIIQNSNNNTLRRNIFMTLTPDEESGGLEGMKVFVDTNEFQSMNIGYALDEGLTTTDNSYLATYLEKRPWQIKFTTYGTAGHGSSLPKATAVDKVEILLSKIKEYRNSQAKIADFVYETDYGAYTTVNVNILQAGGDQINVIPATASLVVDMRLAANVDVKEMDQLVQSWATASGNDTTVEYIRKVDIASSAKMDKANILWTALQDVIRDMGSTVKSIVSPAVSDLLYVRAKGIPALGFSAKTNTVNRMHAHDEYINAETLINGVSTYTHLIMKLGNMLPCEQDIIKESIMSLIVNK